MNCGFQENLERSFANLLSFVSSSILNLPATTVDRYLAIVPEVKKPLTRKNVMKATFAILILSFGWCSKENSLSAAIKAQETTT